MDVVGPRAALVKKWMQDKGIRSCRACGDRREGFTTQAVSAIIQTGTDPLAEAAVMPVIPVICNNCANVVLFHAGRLQIV